MVDKSKEKHEEFEYDDEDNAAEYYDEEDEGKKSSKVMKFEEIEL